MVGPNERLWLCIENLSQLIYRCMIAFFAKDVKQQIIFTGGNIKEPMMLYD